MLQRRLMDQPFDEDKILDGMHKAGDLLVKLGYAESYFVNDATGYGNITWTAKGSALRREIQRIYDEIAEGRGQVGLTEYLSFLNFLNDR
jgi:hypothetical protein